LRIAGAQAAWPAMLESPESRLTQARAEVVVTVRE
jgi:hypothetical protein